MMLTVKLKKNIFFFNLDIFGNPKNNVEKHKIFKFIIKLNKLDLR